jgi:hypothetical protein
MSQDADFSVGDFYEAGSIRQTGLKEARAPP